MPAQPFRRGASEPGSSPSPVPWPTRAWHRPRFARDAAGNAVTARCSPCRALMRHGARAGPPLRSGRRELCPGGGPQKKKKKPGHLPLPRLRLAGGHGRSVLNGSGPLCRRRGSAGAVEPDHAAPAAGCRDGDTTVWALAWCVEAGGSYTLGAGLHARRATLAQGGIRLDHASPAPGLPCRDWRCRLGQLMVLVNSWFESHLPPSVAPLFYAEGWSAPDRLIAWRWARPSDGLSALPCRRREGAACPGGRWPPPAPDLPRPWALILAEHIIRVLSSAAPSPEHGRERGSLRRCDRTGPCHRPRILAPAYFRPRTPPRRSACSPQASPPISA